jgi:formylglycine-generating enzyme required for sulfatase activity
MVGSPGHGPGPNDVGEYPSDLSPYGIADLGGNSQNWTADPRPGPPQVAADVVIVQESRGTIVRTRGGSWNSAGFFCRSDLRRFTHEYGHDQVGFRLVRNFSGGS